MRQRNPGGRDAAVGIVKAAQARERWTDHEVAKRIGCSRSAWRQIRTGERQPGVRMLHHMMAAFPETSQPALSFLLGLAQDSHHVGDVVSSREER
jgi:transcriptional regulator with XRE-family HTH domain